MSYAAYVEEVAPCNDIQGGRLHGRTEVSHTSVQSHLRHIRMPFVRRGAGF